MKNDYSILRVIKWIGIISIVFSTMMIVVIMYAQANTSAEVSPDNLIVMQFYFYKAVFITIITDSTLFFVFGSLYYFIGKIMNSQLEKNKNNEKLK